MKKWYIALVGIVVIAAVVGFFLVSRLSTSEEPQQQVSDPFGQSGLVSGQSGTQSEERIQLVSGTGQVYTIPNFTDNHPSYEQPTGTFYYVTASPDSVEEDGRFSIVYGTDSSISVGLLAEPLGEVRRAAEAKLRSLIPLSNTELCTLNVSVAAPISVSETYAATELGLSFCPGSVQLPG